MDLTLPGVAMLGLSLVCAAAVVAGLGAALRRTGWNSGRQRRVLAATAAVIVAWLCVLGWLAVSGFFADFSVLPPRPALPFLAPLPVVLVLAMRPTVTGLLRVTPAHWLILTQVFRVAVELLLWQGARRGQVPTQMTFEGYNFDVLTGVLAVVIGVWVWRRPNWWVVVGFNVVGLALLLNILVIAVLSMPTPLRVFSQEPANTIVAGFPFIYLPGVLVVIAYSLHILSLRQAALALRAARPGR